MRALFLAALLVAPLAAADHVFSHRVVIEGRLVGGDGLPLPGREVSVSVQGESLTEPCPRPGPNVTDEWGDFRFCYHKHGLADGAVVTVASGNATQRRPLDADLRRMVFLLLDPKASGVAPEGWATTFHLDGRVWERGRTRLDGVNVSGNTWNREGVNVTVVNATRAEGDAAKGSTFALTTDGYGDYAGTVRLFPGERAEDARVLIETRGVQADARLDPLFHRTTVDFRLPIEVAAVDERPGTSTPPVSLALLVGVGLALAAAIWSQKKRI